jgi:hypothetical protein
MIASIFASLSDLPNPGIFFDGDPSSMTRVMSASDGPRVSARVAMFGPRSPPRPSSPWHPAQVVANIAFPADTVSEVTAVDDCACARHGG